MRALGQPYYIGLRSAAESFGATHYALQALHVIVAGRPRPFLLGRQRIRFLQKIDCEGTPTTDVTGPVTTLRYSTPEATALDLVRFSAEAGGMNMVAAALQQMKHRCDADGMHQALVAADDTCNAQRLGYLWSLLGQPALADVVDAWLAGRPKRVTRFDLGDPEAPEASPTDARWKLRLGRPLDVAI